MEPIVAGRLNELVANASDISEITGKAHRGKLMLKMAFDSLAELVKFDAKRYPQS